MKVIQPREFNPRKTLFVGTIILVAIAFSYVRRGPGPENPYWTGETMGTTYSVRMAGWTGSQRNLQKFIDDVDDFLVAFNNQMSTYLPDSEISRFNATTSTDPFPVSGDFAEVTEKAILLSRLTDQAFDPTVAPLVDLWGFGPAGGEDQDPDDALIEQVMKSLGPSQVEVLDTPALKKGHPEVRLDLNAIAKGHAADKVADKVAERGVSNLFVEIGGECVARGVNLENNPWRIGIDTPALDALPGESVQTILHVSGGAVATSGDYRNYRTDEKGKRISHIIDPRSGHPISHAVASVSVVAPTCIDADALATAFLVMGDKEGLKKVETLEDVEALFIIRNEDGTFREVASSGLGKYLR